MKITMQFEGVFLGATSSNWTNRESGQSGTTYKCSIKQGGGVGEIKCDKMLFDMYNSGQVEDLTRSQFVGQFDSDYRTFTIVAIHPLK